MPCGRQHLKLVRLPISPPPLEVNCMSIPKGEGMRKLPRTLNQASETPRCAALAIGAVVERAQAGHASGRRESSERPIANASRCAVGFPLQRGKLACLDCGHGCAWV